MLCPGILFFFHWHYSPRWASACRRISSHFFLPIINSLDFLTPSTCRAHLLPLFILFCVFPFSSTLSVLEWRSFLCPGIYVSIFLRAREVCNLQMWKLNSNWNFKVEWKSFFFRVEIVIHAGCSVCCHTQQIVIHAGCFVCCHTQHTKHILTYLTATSSLRMVNTTTI